MALKKLKIDLDDLAQAMEDQSRDIHDYWLDTETGAILLVGSEVTSALDDKDEEALAKLPEWQKAEVAAARAIQADEQRYQNVPETMSSDAFEVMRDFVYSVEDAAIRDRLQKSLSGPKPFRRFKDEIQRSPKAVGDAWYAYEQERQHAEAREWLESIGIEAEHTPGGPKEK